MSLERAKQLFVQLVADFPPEQWEARLADLAGRDEELRRQVSRILAAHRDAGSFLESPATVVGRAMDEAGGERPGTVIGPYKLLEPIGEGGMGSVWMAQQTEPVRRLVAAKLIKPGMDSRAVLARFEAERQALALMDHPNIAKVLDGGATSAGRPYFVMDLVKGAPITRYCDEHRLTPRQRLELFVPVCQAIQHAHQKGIIHRDVKPSNVLVAQYDGKPVVKVIDFGVAKAAGQQLTDKTLVTGFGNIVGTLEYMSPEQAEVNQLDVDTRSDVYSLGVLLYELLTGTTPFSRQELEKGGVLEMLRVIREQEPSKPSTKLSTAEGLPTLAANRGTEPAKLTRLVRGELDWIVMKALEKDRNRRYDTANGFALDVQRYLADESVLACPPSVGYRFRKFARRNRGKVLGAAVLAVASLVVVSVIGWAVRDRAARQEAAQREQATRQVRATGQVRLILDEVARLERERKWPEALDAARQAWDLVARGEVEPEVAERVQNTLGELELVRLVEDVRADTSEWKEGGFDCRGAAERYAAAFRDYCGIELNQQVAPEEAAERLRSRSAVLAALIPALDDWAVCRRVVGDEPGAARLRRIVGLLDADTWRYKVRQAVGARDVKALLALVTAADVDRQSAATLQALGLALGREGRLDEAIRLLSLAQRLHPADYWIHFALAQQALNHKEPPNLEQAAGCYRAALAVRPRSAAAWNNLGVVLHNQDKLDEAIACYNVALRINPRFERAHVHLGLTFVRQGKLDEAIACQRKAIELDPKNSPAYTNLGAILSGQGKLKEAIACHNKAVRLDPKNAFAHASLGVALARQGKLEEAIASCKKAIELRASPHAHARAYWGLGNASSRQQKLIEAALHYREAVRLNSNDATLGVSLGNALLRLGKLDDAAASYRKVIGLKPNDPLGYGNLGLVLQAQGNLEGAMRYYQTALRLDPKHVPALSNAGNGLLRQDKPDEALVYHQRAVELDPTQADHHTNLGHSLSALKRFEDAIACYGKALELDPKHVKAHNNLGIALRKKKDLDGAITHFHKAIELDPKYADAHNNLGIALRDKKDLDGAITHFHKAIELDPKLALPHNNLGDVLREKKDLEGSITHLRKAIDLDPKLALPHYNLGNTLKVKGDLDGAVTHYQKAIQLAPTFAKAHCNLGLVLSRQGKFAEALTMLKKGHALGIKQPGWNYPSDQWVKNCERLLELEQQLPAILKGEQEPKDAAERAELATFCLRYKNLPATAASWYAEAFAREPKLAAGRRYPAACAAALAAAGQGKDTDKLDEKAKANLRKQALDWLKADLAVLARQMQSNPKVAPTVHQILQQRLDDPALAAVRDPQPLSRLPDTERLAWEQFWGEVRRLLPPKGKSKSP